VVRRYQNIIILLLVLIQGTLQSASPCGLNINSREKLDKALTLIEGGKKKLWKNIEKALEKTPPPKEPDLHQTILKEITRVPDPEAFEILYRYATSENVVLREQALQSLGQLLGNEEEGSEKQTADADKIYRIIEKNSETFNRLTPTEIALLGNINKKEAVDLLNLHFLNYSEDDPLIIKSLALQLSRARNNQNQENGKTDDPMLTHLEAIFHDLLQYKLPPETLTNTLDTLWQVYHPESAEKMLEIYNTYIYPTATREAAIETLKKNDPIRAEKAAEEIRARLKKGTIKGDDRSKALALLSIITGKKSDTLAKELSAATRKLPEGPPEWMVKKYKKMAPFDAIKSLMKPHRISVDLLKKIDKHLRSLAENEEVRLNTPRMVIHAALQQIYPEKDFTGLNKKILNGLSTRGLFYYIMAIIDKDFDSLENKYLMVEEMMGVTPEQSVKLYHAFKKEESLLKAISR